jgi:ribosomal protein S19
MSRSKWKINFTQQSILDSKKLRSRESIIPYSLVKKTIFVYTGRDYQKIYVSRDKVGFKAGEFSSTRGRKFKKLKGKHGK